MLVELKTLKPNPLRDFTVDPVDDERVAELAKSIKEDGFWGGVVCRRGKDGDIEVGAGQHRIKAALKAGLKQADLFIGDFDDDGMLRVYATENALQRGNTSTALAGSVAAAVRRVAKLLLGGGDVSKIFETSPKGLEILRGQIASDKGIGQEVLVRRLAKVPGINNGVVMQQLAALKASGDYARIIGEVQAEIEREYQEAVKALKKAEAERRRIQKEREEAEQRERAAELARREASARAKAAREEAERQRAREAEHQAKIEHERARIESELAEKRRKEFEEETERLRAEAARGEEGRGRAERAAYVASTEPVPNGEGEPSGERKPRAKRFDLEGVAQHLKNPHQLDVFRKCVTGEGIAPYLPVENQAALAARLVELAHERDAELTGAFIRENVSAMVLQVKGAERKMSREEKEGLLREDKKEKAKAYQEEFARNCRWLAATAVKLRDLRNDWPAGTPFPVSKRYRDDLKRLRTLLNDLYESDLYETT